MKRAEPAFVEQARNRDNRCVGHVVLPKVLLLGASMRRGHLLRNGRRRLTRPRPRLAQSEIRAAEDVVEAVRRTGLFGCVLLVHVAHHFGDDAIIVVAGPEAAIAIIRVGVG